MILRGLPNDDRLNENPDTGWVGVKDLLREDQYTYDYDAEELRIDFSEHTVYVRARFVFVLHKDAENNQYIFSEWSDIASCGKDAKKYEPLTAKDIPAPVITNLRMTDEDFNGNPVVAYTLTVPEDPMKKTVDVEAARGAIVIETYARVKGDSEWTGMGNSDWEIKPGEMKNWYLKRQRSRTRPSPCRPKRSRKLRSLPKKQRPWRLNLRRTISVRSVISARSPWDCVSSSGY